MINEAAAEKETAQDQQCFLVTNISFYVPTEYS